MQGDAQAVPAELAPGTLIGGYRIERRLAVGGMAVVYAAVHPLIGKRAAIKVMSHKTWASAPGAVDRIVLEARAVNQIGHPNIVDIFNVGQLPDGRSYLVMEWLRGQTLYERLWESAPLPLPEVVHILDQVCDALAAAHAHGIVHRDLKPANIFLCAQRGRPDEVKLLDFGIAQVRARDLRASDEDGVVGTPDYVSPEQARGDLLDERSDLYSLGVVAYEMVLGRLPFLCSNAADAFFMHRSARPPRPSILWPAIPPPLEDLLLALLAKDPARRPSLETTRSLLWNLADSSAPPAPKPLPPSRSARPPGSPRRRPAWRMGALAAALTVIGLIVYRPVQLRAQHAHRVATEKLPRVLPIQFPDGGVP
jgi:serine/threonine-protein kinase